MRQSNASCCGCISITRKVSEDRTSKVPHPRPVVVAENKDYIVFVHPAEFLVTAPDGSIAQRTILGDRLLIEPGQAGGEHDQKRVFTFDLPLNRGENDP